MQDQPIEPEIKEELSRLRAELTKLNSHRFVRVHNSTIRLVLFQFVRGLAFGLGTVVGASILVTFVLYLLSNIDFIPVVGEWAAEIADIIRDSLTSRPDNP